MTRAFDMIMNGLDDVDSYVDGARKGFVVHIPEEVDVKAIRQRLNLSQPKFAATFGFSVGRIRDWEQKRFPVDAPSRVFLTVIEREPAAVLRALTRQPSARKRTAVAREKEPAVKSSGRATGSAGRPRPLKSKSARASRS